MRRKDNCTPYETLLTFTIPTRYYCYQHGNVLYLYNSKIVPEKDSVIYIPFCIDDVVIKYKGYEN